MLLDQEDAEKVPRERKSVPQRLKPPCEENTYGTAEAVPLTRRTLSTPSKAI
jgi:hypothetical protein